LNFYDNCITFVSNLNLHIELIRKFSQQNIIIIFTISLMIYGLTIFVNCYISIEKLSKFLYNDLNFIFCENLALLVRESFLLLILFISNLFSFFFFELWFLLLCLNNRWVIRALTFKLTLCGYRYLCLCRISLIGNPRLYINIYSSGRCSIWVLNFYYKSDWLPHSILSII